MTFRLKKIEWRELGIGREALRQAAAPATKSVDLDEPLPEATMKSLNQDWARRYNLQLDPSLEPCEALRSRLVPRVSERPAHGH